MLFSSSVMVGVRIRFSVWLASGYAHVFALLSVVIVTLLKAHYLYRSPLPDYGINTLPQNVTSAPSPTDFRKCLKTQLFNRSFPKSSLASAQWLSFRTQ